MKHALVLAPMEGVVDSVMRTVLTEINDIDWCVSEFVRVTTRTLLKREFLKLIPEIETSWRTPSGTLIYPQLLGGNPFWLAENAKLAVDLGAPGIDLNFGCPAPTVNRHDGGATLLKNPHRLFDVVSAVRTAVPAHLPVSAKMRLGFDHKNDYLVLAQACEDGGASWLTVHARTKTDGYKPPAYWEYIAEIRAHLKIPVIANGEIWSPEDFERCQNVTGCHQLMLGRGIIARPFLIHEIRTNSPIVPWRLVKDLVVRLGDLSDSTRAPRYATARVKQWLKMLSRNYVEAAAAFEFIKQEHDYLKLRAKFLEFQELSSLSSSPDCSSAAASV